MCSPYRSRSPAVRLSGCQCGAVLACLLLPNYRSRPCRNASLVAGNGAHRRCNNCAENHVGGRLSIQGGGPYCADVVHSSRFRLVYDGSRGRSPSSWRNPGLRDSPPVEGEAMPRRGGRVRRNGGVVPPLRRLAGGRRDAPTGDEKRGRPGLRPPVRLVEPHLRALYEEEEGLALLHSWKGYGRAGVRQRMRV